MKRHEEKVARDFTAAGAVAAAVYNVNRAKGAPFLGPADIFSFLRKSDGVPREATPTEIDLMFRNIAGNFKAQGKNGSAPHDNGQRSTD